MIPPVQLTCVSSKQHELFSSLQFRYKSRIYKQPHVEEKQISKLHTKVRPGVQKQTHPETARIKPAKKSVESTGH